MNDFAVIDPVTGQRLKSYPTASTDELDQAIALADRTYRSWGRAS